MKRLVGRSVKNVTPHTPILKNMRNPQIRFQINEKQEMITARLFIKEAHFSRGKNLEWAFFNRYPELKKLFKDFDLINPDKFQEFIHLQYLKQKKNMLKALNDQKKIWNRISFHYFKLVKSLFRNHEWPKGEYIAFGTIWGMYPRFLERKVFQIPFQHKKTRYIPVVIAHEMLHFIFYDYFYKKYPKYKDKKYNFFVWHVSEIFNTTIQNSPKWLSVFKEKSPGYPEHQNIIRSIKKWWENDPEQDIDQLVEKILKAVKKSKLIKGNP